jgi:hypothetical protein
MTQKPFKILAIALLCLAGLMLSQRVALADVTLQFTGPTTGANLSGVYTDPYNFNVYASSYPPGPTQNESYQLLTLSCDDFSTEIFQNEMWDAIQTPLSALTPSTADPNLKFDQSNSMTVRDGAGNILFADVSQMQAYDAVAWLAEQIVNGATNPHPLDASLASYAIWQIFECNSVNQITTANDGNASADKATIYADIDLAFTNGPSIKGSSDVSIFTPQPQSAAQEFIDIGSDPQPNELKVPEASTVVSLGLDFLALPGIIFLVGRRIRREA